MTVSYGFHYFSPTQHYAISSATQPRLTTLPQYQHISALESHDIQLRYQVSGAFAIYFGSNNFTNQQPDLGFGLSGQPASPFGRTYYVGVTTQIPEIPGL